MSLNSCSNTLLIKAEALRLGFSACGIAQASTVADEDARLYENYIASGRHAGMKYLENYFEKRCDPRLLVEGTCSVLSVALNYYPAQLLSADRYQVARYAYGADYHEVMRDKLGRLLAFIRGIFPAARGRAFCDTGPVLERYWAYRAGLGWIGKNRLLTIPHAGSHFFLGELLLDMELAYDAPQKNRCGSCTRCLRACPAGALDGEGLDARKCLSYLSIEYKGELTMPEAGVLGNRIYGCDECIKACPWNRFATPSRVPEFQPSAAFLQMRREDWHRLGEAEYGMLFEHSAVRRAGYGGLMRNLKFLG